MSDYSKLELFLPGNGANNGTVFPDYSKNNYKSMPSGDVKTKTDQYKFYDSSIYFDGTGDAITTGAIDVGSSDFAIEFWFRPTDSNRRCLFAYTSSACIAMDYHYNGTRNVNIWASSNGSAWNMIHADSGGAGIGTISLALNTWSHIVFSRTGTTFRSFINGVKDREVTASGSIYFGNRSLRLGLWDNGAYPLLGHMQEFKVYVGENPYTANFTPATAPTINTISNSGATSVLDDTGTAAIRRVVAVTRGNDVARAFVTTTDSSGNYSLSVPGEVGFNVIFEDDVAGSTYSDILVSHVTPS